MNALLSVGEGIDASFIELAAGEKLYPWVTDKSFLADRLITLEKDLPYEHCSPSVLSSRVIETLTRLQPDVVVIAGYSEPPMRAAARWARIHGKQVVLMSDSTERDYKRHWWREQIKRRWVSRYVNAGFVAGSASRDYLKRLGLEDERIWEPYDVVDNHYFTAQVERIRNSSYLERERAGLPTNYFLYVGRFSSEKNLPVLLRAYRIYRDANETRWGLVLVGDGPQRQELLNIAQVEGLNEVIWPGFTHIQELSTYYALADCFVLSSAKDSWGLVVNEAMASGLPVLVSNGCGCSPNLVHEGRNGFTFDPNDPSQLAGLMTKISTLSPARLDEMGQASREIISEFTPEDWARNLSQAIFTLMRDEEPVLRRVVAQAS